jgi:hypothetical protein
VAETLGGVILTMEPRDLTPKLLTEIRDELRSIREVVERHSDQFELQNERMFLVETVLRELSEQILMMGRGLRTAL